MSCEEDKFFMRLISDKETEDVFYSLINKEHWNQSLSRIKAIHEVFPSNIFVMIKRETEEVIAVVIAIPTHPGQFIVGDLVVREDHRKQGLGARMMQMVVEKHSHFTLTLISMHGTESFYRKLGLQEVGPTHCGYYLEVDREMVKQICSDNPLDNDISINLYTNGVFPALNKYDTNARGYDCGKYLSVMTKTSSHFLVASSRTLEKMIGYASCIETANILRFDGMYADSDTVALHIFREMIEAFPHIKEIRVQTIKPREFLIQFGNLLPKTQTFTRMATGPVPDVCLSKLYAVNDCGYTE